MLQVLGLGLLAVGVYALLDSEKQEQHERYQRKARQVQRESEQHRRHLAQQVQHHQARLEYRQAIAAHHAAVLTGGEMFALYDCAKSTLKALQEQAALCQAQIAQLKKQRSQSKGLIREKKHQTLEQFYTIHQSIVAEIRQYQVEKNRHWQELQLLNQETRRLKFYIRDHMGSHGRAWFARLEQRKASA